MKQNWKIDILGSPFMEFQAKIKKVKRALVSWSKEVFGNIFQQIATLVDAIKIKETQFKIIPSTENRMELSGSRIEEISKT